MSHPDCILDVTSALELAMVLDRGSDALRDTSLEADGGHLVGSALMELAMFLKTCHPDKDAEAGMEIVNIIGRLLTHHKLRPDPVEGTAFFAIGKACHLPIESCLIEIFLKVCERIRDDHTAFNALIALENVFGDDSQLAPSLTPQQRQAFVAFFHKTPHIWKRDPSLYHRVERVILGPL